TADGQVELANRQLLDYLGISLEALKSWETSGIVHPDDLPGAATVWRQSLESGEPYELELRVRDAGGVYQWVGVRGLPLRNAQGRVVRWCVLLTDIAERKRTEAALHEREREARMLVNGIPGLFSTFSPSGEIEILSQRMLEYFGKPVEEMKHWENNDIIHPEDLPRVLPL